MTNIIDLTKRVRDFRDTYRGIDELGACDLLDEAAHVLHTLGADLYKAEGQRDALAQKLDSANGCISDWVTFGAEVTEALGLKVMSPKDILREIERLRGLRPEIPERPPHNNDASHQHPALPRYGLRWNGPGEPVSVPMPDGYWTPFHLALESLTMTTENQAPEGGHAEPVAWRWKPSEVFDQYVLIGDKDRAELARRHGMAVEPLYRAAQAAPAITEAEIDRVAALTEKAMEEGLRGFMKTWGWQQFARTLVENLRPYGLRIAPKEPTNDR